MNETRWTNQDYLQNDYTILIRQAVAAYVKSSTILSMDASAGDSWMASVGGGYSMMYIILVKQADI